MWTSGGPDGPLLGLRVAVLGRGTAVLHAGRLLASLGAAVVSDHDVLAHVDGVIDTTGALPVDDDIPAVRTAALSAGEDWASSGALALTGREAGPALASPGWPASVARGALLATELLAKVGGRIVALPGSEVLSERAAIAGLRRGAPCSAGRAFRVLRAADGWVGLNLARASDTELIPAWLEEPVVVADPWPAVSALVAERDARALAGRARLLGLPAAAYPSSCVDDEQLAARDQLGEVSPLVLNGQVRRVVERTGTVEPVARRDWTLPPTLVVDLSSLWAGPLCGHILTILGARVVKVESVDRPDGARFGPAAFYDLLHAGQESVAVDLRTSEGRAVLAGLVDVADVVIEGSRPRALRQLGVVAEEVLARARTKCWASITGYGRTGPWSNAVGFGDDTAVAGGLLAFDPGTGMPAPCGDAIADPLTGVHAALVATACRLGGGTWLADLALREHAAATLTVPTPAAPVGEATGSMTAPTTRRPSGRAPALGADTDRVLAELGLPR